MPYLKELKRLRLEEETFQKNSENHTQSPRTVQIKRHSCGNQLAKVNIHVLAKRFDRENPDKCLKDKIIKIHIENKDCGYRRVYRELRNRKIFVNKKKVQCIMRKLGFQITSFTHKSRKCSSCKDQLLKVKFKMQII